MANSLAFQHGLSRCDDATMTQKSWFDDTMTCLKIAPRYDLKRSLKAAAMRHSYQFVTRISLF